MSTNRDARARPAEDTVRILASGRYTAPGGAEVDVSTELRRCIEGTELFSAEQIDALRAAGPATRASGPTAYDVRNETTLEGLAAMLRVQDGAVAVLNFASARNPGGGFLGGSQAQEESLARSSGLYASLQVATPFYETHRASPSLLYSDAMIHSPHCPVFRDDAGQLLVQPLKAGFITSPAPNAGAIAASRQHEEPLILPTLLARAEGILALASALGYSRLLLGAWGCGVFRNDPHQVAEAFARPLLRGAFSGVFSEVRFSVLDRTSSATVHAAFRNMFAG